VERMHPIPGATGVAVQAGNYLRRGERGPVQSSCRRSRPGPCLLSARLRDCTYILSFFRVLVRDVLARPALVVRVGRLLLGRRGLSSIPVFQVISCYCICTRTSAPGTELRYTALVALAASCVRAAFPVSGRPCGAFASSSALYRKVTARMSDEDDVQITSVVPAAPREFGRHHASNPLEQFTNALLNFQSNNAGWMDDGRKATLERYMGNALSTQVRMLQAESKYGATHASFYHSYPYALTYEIISALASVLFGFRSTQVLTRLDYRKFQELSFAQAYETCRANGEGARIDWRDIFRETLVSALPSEMPSDSYDPRQEMSLERAARRGYSGGMGSRDSALSPRTRFEPFVRPVLDAFGLLMWDDAGRRRLFEGIAQAAEECGYFAPFPSPIDAAVGAAGGWLAQVFVPLEMVRTHVFGCGPYCAGAHPFAPRTSWQVRIYADPSAFVPPSTGCDAFAYNFNPDVKRQSLMTRLKGLFEDVVPARLGPAVEGALPPPLLEAYVRHARGRRPATVPASVFWRLGGGPSSSRSPRGRRPSALPAPRGGAPSSFSRRPTSPPPRPESGRRGSGGASAGGVGSMGASVSRARIMPTLRGSILGAWPPPTRGRGVARAAAVEEEARPKPRRSARIAARASIGSLDGGAGAAVSSMERRPIPSAFPRAPGATGPAGRAASSSGLVEAPLLLPLSSAASSDSDEAPLLLPLSSATSSDSDEALLSRPLSSAARPRSRPSGSLAAAAPERPARAPLRSARAAAFDPYVDD
jgi:hypothetical protein